MFSVTRQDTANNRRRTLHQNWFNEQKRMEKNLKQNPHGYAQTDNETPKKIHESIRSEGKSEKKSEGVFSRTNPEPFERIASTIEHFLNDQNPTSEVSE